MHEAAHGPDIISFLVGMIIVLIAAKLGGEIVERLKQPAVLGELGAGIVLGNLALWGVTWFEPFKTNDGLLLMAELGVILLLFEVGLESNMADLFAVGTTAMIVAHVGIILPMILGYGVSMLFLPEQGWYVHLFAGATLAATSVGITARVMQDLKKTDTKEARIVLGAAVVDDVLGLIVLAVVAGMVTSLSSGEAKLDWTPVIWIVLKAAGFLVGAVVIGRRVHVNALRIAQYFHVHGVVLALALSYCFALAALAGVLGLAPIVGAFAAGLVLEESDYEVFKERGDPPISSLVKPIATIFVPIFFVFMGVRVDLRAFASWQVLGLAAALTVVAILGKQACSLAVFEKGVNRLVIGIGMIPRGEVGLIFVGMASTLRVAGKPIFDAGMISAMVVMVMLTTVMTPPLLKWAFDRKPRVTP
jgi:Kef-type K+ transport system membrane component KefB